MGARVRKYGCSMPETRGGRARPITGLTREVSGSERAGGWRRSSDTLPPCVWETANGRTGKCSSQVGLASSVPI